MIRRVNHPSRINLPTTGGSGNVRDMVLAAVGFDIDGTLYPDRRMWLRFLPIIFKHYPLVSAFARVRKEIRRRGRVPDIDALEVRLFAEAAGLEEGRARKLRDQVFFQEWEKRFENVRPYPFVREALERLKGFGLKIAALSDFPIGKKLEYFGLDDLFDVALGYRDVGQLKPRPEPFLQMAEQLGVEPASMIYVGNRLEYDVHGAEAAGMRGALVGPPGRRAPGHVTTYKDYRDLASRIGSEVNR